MEEVKKDVTIEEVETIEKLELTEEVENKKIYEFKKLNADDVFTMVGIISKIGVNKFANVLKSDEIRNLAKDLRDKEEIDIKDISLLTGGAVLLEVVQVIFEGLPKCKEEIYTLLSNASNLSIEEVKTLEAVTLFEMIVDFVKKEEFMDFIKAASRLVKKVN